MSEAELKRKLAETSFLKEFKIPIVGVAVSNIIFNSLLILALKKTNSLQTISHKFIFILSISDTIFSLIFSIITLIYLQLPVEWAMSIYFALLTFYYQFSVLLILSIGLDRYVHMKYLTNYPSIFTEKRARILIILILLLAIAQTALMIYLSMQREFVIPLLIVNLTTLLCIITLCVLYWRAYKSIETRTRQMNLGNDNESNATSQNQNQSGDDTAIAIRRSPTREFARAVFIILGVLIVCYVPSMFTSVIYTIQLQRQNANRTSLFVASGFSLLAFFNATLNAIVVLVFNRKVNNYLNGLVHMFR